jgi:hypothetical protein
MDNTTLLSLQSALRRLLPESISDTLAELKKHLPDFYPKYSTLLLLESRLNDANLQRIEGTMSEENLQLCYNQIRADLLLFINGLEVNDFALPVAGAAAKTGSLLYKIPTRMTLQKETKCLVRLAFEKESILRNIELDADVEIKTVRVAEVMQVELIDPTEPHPFSIRSISDEEQFVEKGDYSEWCFYVKPLLEGTFPLVLKISVIEMVMGKERLRNLTYEENIQITATAAPEEVADFKPLGVTVGTIESPIPTQEPESEAFMPAPVLPSAAPTRLPPSHTTHQQPVAPIAPTPAKRRRFLPGALAAAASVLLILTVAIFSINNNSAPGLIEPPSNSVEENPGLDTLSVPTQDTLQSIE